MCCHVMAQDTIDGKIHMSNYFYPNDWLELDKVRYGVANFLGMSGGGEFGFLFETTDTLTIYGIAAGIKELNRSFVYYQDTSYANSFEFLRIYEEVHTSVRDTLRCIDQVMVHLHTTPIAYYADHSDWGVQPTRIFPMYEQYFNAPIIVVDSFYVGMTQYIPRDNYNDVFACPPLALGAVGTGSPRNLKTISYWLQGTSPGWKTGHFDNYPLIFPILTPEPSVVTGDTNIISSDTVIVGDTLFVTDSIVVWDTVVVNDTSINCDTLYSSDTTVICDTTVSIDTIVTLDTIVRVDTVLLNDTTLVIPERGLMGRLIGVMPNPATATAKVVSSFGVTMVEVFNTAGERIHTLRLPDAPLTATLDVRRWPRGSYIVRIHTPMGTTSRKLVVQ